MVMRIQLLLLPRGWVSLGDSNVRKTLSAGRGDRLKFEAIARETVPFYQSLALAEGAQGGRAVAEAILAMLRGSARR
jgi:hypothetical protein